MRQQGSGSRLWIFDFDGTLSPIVADRTAARLHPASRALLADLVRDPANRVAVLSNRTIEDLVPRVPVPGVVLGGSSGLEWRMPGGRGVAPRPEMRRKLAEARSRILPVLGRLDAVPGVEIEDKQWSFTVHYRRVPAKSMPGLIPLLDGLERRPGIRVCTGQMAAEVQLFPRIDKAFGVRRLCRLLAFSPRRWRLFYAGDDENDEPAMQWVLAQKGTVVAVGKAVRIPGVLVVPGASALARAARAQAGL